jgi:hypothetical protein
LSKIIVSILMRLCRNILKNKDLIVTHRLPTRCLG